MQDVSSSIELDIRRLEAGIHQLKIQYDLFFAGSLPKEPSELRIELEGLIRRNTTAAIGKYAHRFHFNSLVSRYNSLSELWSKTIRSREEGEPDGSGPENGDGEVEPLSITCDITDPLKSETDLREFHIRFVAARKRLAREGNGDISFERFLRGITRQGRLLRERSGCREIELRLEIAEDSVHVKARPRQD